MRHAEANMDDITGPAVNAACVLELMADAMTIYQLQCLLYCFQNVGRKVPKGGFHSNGIKYTFLLPPKNLKGAIC